MDPLEAITNSVAQQAVTCDVYRNTSNGPYEDATSPVDTAEIAFSAPSAQSQVVIEGSFEETSLVGHIVPEYDGSGALIKPVHVNDELRPQDSEHRYDVRTVVGVPSEVGPELWEIGVMRANASR